MLSIRHFGSDGFNPLHLMRDPATCTLVILNYSYFATCTHVWMQVEFRMVKYSIIFEQYFLGDITCRNMAKAKLH